MRLMIHCKSSVVFKSGIAACREFGAFLSEVAINGLRTHYSYTGNDRCARWHGTSPETAGPDRRQDGNASLPADSCDAVLPADGDTGRSTTAAVAAVCFRSK
jgi:hypothetical protein